MNISQTGVLPNSRSYLQLLSSSSFVDRTLYVDGIPRNWTRSDLQSHFKQFGNITFIDLPVLSTLTSTQTTGGGGGGGGGKPVANTSESVVSGRNKGYAFVEFELADEMRMAVSSPATLIIPNTKSSLQVMPKSKWLELAAKYKAYLKQRKRLTQITAIPTDYTPKTVLRFSNVCADSNKGVLNALFGQSGVEPAYIDYNRENTHGLIRMKTLSDSETIVEYFSQTHVRQLSCGDTIGDVLPGPMPDKTIKIEYLKVEEELLEWDRLIESRQIHASGRRPGQPHSNKKRDTSTADSKKRTLDPCDNEERESKQKKRRF